MNLLKENSISHKKPINHSRYNSRTKMNFVAPTFETGLGRNIGSWTQQ